MTKLTGDEWVPPNFVIIGGGPVTPETLSALPRAYEAMWVELGVQIGAAEWQAWWDSTGLPPGEIFFWAGSIPPRISVRRYKHMVRLQVDRTHERGWADPGAAGAVADLTALLDKVVDRFATAPYPQLTPTKGAR